jgi:hypothetical protein
MQREPVNSSSVRSIGYDNGTLEVEFNQGLIYQYYQVPVEIYENIFKCESIGSYIFKNVKKEFPYKLVKDT